MYLGLCRILESFERVEGPPLSQVMTDARGNNVLSLSFAGRSQGFSTATFRHADQTFPAAVPSPRTLRPATSVVPPPIGTKLLEYNMDTI